MQQGFSLSPYFLPLKPGIQYDTSGLWQGLHGVFNDSLPDGWGLLLMDRELRKTGIDPHQITPLDRLAWLGHRTMGALVYEPCTQTTNDPLLIDIHNLAQNAQHIFAGESDEVLPELFRAGGSPGGARPKALIATKDNEMITADSHIPEGFTPWLVKFNAKGDFPDAGHIEYAYSLIAKDAGIHMPETQLMAEQYFAVQRFDRQQDTRTHVHTLGNMVGADFRMPTLDYLDLLKVVQDVTKSQLEVKKAFQQMLFNIAVHNRDDHSKNFAFIWSSKENAWRLSPAYDLMFSNGIHGEHTMTVAGEGKAPKRKHIMQIAKKFGLEKTIDELLEPINQVVGKWGDYTNTTGVLNESQRILQKYISPIV